MARLTVGVYARDRFALTSRSLAALVENTEIQFKLLVIDCGMADRFRRDVDRVLANVPNAEVVEPGFFLRPNQSRNLVVERSDTEYVCLLESDVMVQPGCIDQLVATADRTGAAVTRPTIYQRWGVIHFDRSLGPLEGDVGEPGARLRIGAATRPEEFEDKGDARPVEWSEFHCIVLRRSAMSEVFPLDGELTEPEHVDFSLRLRSASAPVVFEPHASVRLVSPPPVHRDDLTFFHFRWDMVRGRDSHARFYERWNVDYPGLVGWMETVPSRRSWRRYAGLRWRRWMSLHIGKLR